jgi:uncharacterized membrane protein YcfT
VSLLEGYDVPGPVRAEASHGGRGTERLPRWNDQPTQQLPQWNDQPTQQLPRWDDQATHRLAPVAATPPAGPATPPAEPAAQAGPTAQAEPAPARAGWADVAKGACILLVVLWHVIMKHHLQIDWHLPVPLPGAWGAFGEQLLPLRMPVFFTISGVLAANAAQRPWRVVRRGRIARFGYLYVLWFAVHTTVLAFVPNFDTLAAHSAWQIVEQLTITPTNLWYLIALAVYFVIAKLTRTLPAPAVLGAAFVLSAVASAGWLAAPGNRGQLYQNLFFFLAGLRLKPWVQRWAGTVNRRSLLLTGGGYMLVMLAIRVLDAGTWFGVRPVASVLAVLIGIAIAVRLERVRFLAGPLARLGRNTLPIYVMHMPILALMHAALLRPFSAAGTGVQLVLAAVLPAVLTALLVAICLTLHRWLLALRATWLFDMPGQTGPSTSRAGADRG